MNHKIYVCFFIATIVLCNNPLTLSARNPLDVLGLDEDVTDTEIKKQCRRLQSQYHADKGGDDTLAAIINNACEDLLKKGRKECENKQLGAKCICANNIFDQEPNDFAFLFSRNKCIKGFTENTIRCNCPLSNGTYQEPLDEDECVNDISNNENPCYCPDSDTISKCQYGTMKDGNLGYRCECEAPKTTRSSTNPSNTAPSTPESSEFKENLDPIKHYNSGLIYSINIAAPIYNLPLQRVLQPTSDCAHWWFAFAPFTQNNDFGEITTDKLGRFDIHNTESGLMLNIGYYDSWWYVHTLSSLAQSNTKVRSNFEDEQHPGHSRFGNLDALIGVGLQTKHDSWKLNGEYFIGGSDQRIQNGTVKHLTEPLSLGTGIQGNFDFTVYENISSRYELSTFSRFTYFVPTLIEWHDAKDHHKLCTVRYSPGGFIDLFLALKQYYDCGGQFIIDFGYNPTFHVINQSTETLKTDMHTNLDTFAETIPSVRHSFYSIYGYNWDAGTMPMNISVGGSFTIAPHTNTYGTFFANYSLGF